VHIETGKFYAAKVISKRLMAGREHMVRNEIAVLRKISMGHENILTLVDYFETVNSRTYPGGEFPRLMGSVFDYGFMFGWRVV
jgi:hypothetical protein